MRRTESPLRPLPSNKKMKIAIDPGHNCLCSNGKHDIGASGYAQEDDLTLELGELISKKLQQLKHIPINCLPSTAYSVGHSLSSRVNKANQAAADIFVSLHFNALNGRAYGSEIFALSQAGAAIARPILNNIVKLGYTHRGVKQGGFYVLRHTSMPAILIECAFVDNKKDMAIYDAGKMADAIVKGLVGELPPTVHHKPGTLKVTQKTYLKPSTKQSSQIPNQQLTAIIPAEYAIADLVGMEEGHYLIRMADGSQHFIYSGHAVVEVN